MNIDQKRIVRLKKEIAKYNDVPAHHKLSKEYDKLSQEVEKFYQECMTNIDKLAEPNKYIDKVEPIKSKEDFVKCMDNIKVMKGKIMKSNKSANYITNMYMEMYEDIAKCREYLEKQKMDITMVE